MYDSLKRLGYRDASLIVKSYELKINRGRVERTSHRFLACHAREYVPPDPPSSCTTTARRPYPTEISLLPFVLDQSLPRFIKQRSYRVYIYNFTWRFFYAVAKLRIDAMEFYERPISFNIANYIIRRSLEMI